MTVENRSQRREGASCRRPGTRAFKARESEISKCPREILAFFEEHLILIKFFLFERHSVSISYTEPNYFVESVVIKDLIQEIF